ncbi:MAG TPA: methyltransferase domain-containing protein [Aggregatilinea sp.]|uniref:class I SAM-dependent methyltransferase n=1 Tax=Aggregatilinea sp. TaxID=2806333 RepID=UPI002CDECB3C|nr:methyltransferase domain-containing protein [Aggregatilinea sp.]HML21330.1 methyltransferase domain-containing protein [Aggregatilinea sp.]
MDTDRYQKLYDRLAPFYAPAMRLFPMWRRYTEAVLPWLPASGIVLEVGPGPGVLLTEIAARVPLAVGLDLSPAMLRRAAGRLRRANRRPCLARGNVLRLPFAAETVDGVVLTFVFSAVPDGQAAMKEMARILRPGGVLALVDACEPADRNRAALFLARMWTRFGDVMRDEAALMQAAGLEVVECREFGAFHSIRLTVGRKPDAR